MSPPEADLTRQESLGGGSRASRRAQMRPGMRSRMSEGRAGFPTSLGCFRNPLLALRPAIPITSIVI